MGRFSPRPHQLQPYMEGGLNAATKGLSEGLRTVTGIKDRSRRTAVAEQEAESRQVMREAQIRNLEDALLSAQIDRAVNWDYREEAPIVAEGPSSQQPQQEPSAPTAIPDVGGMPGPAEGPSTEAPTDSSMSPALPYIQGTKIPGDRFPRVNVPGGSMLEQPRSYHQGKENLEQAHTEIHGEPMPGVSGALAQGLKPYEFPRKTSSGLSWEEWKARQDYTRENKGPSAGDKSREFTQTMNEAEAYAGALVAQGVDPMEALREAQRIFGVYPDVGTVHGQQRRVNAELDAVYRYAGYPPNDWAAHAIREMAVGRRSKDDALMDYRNAADPNSDFGIEDPVTGEHRKMTPDELKVIEDYVSKYGSVDQRKSDLDRILEGGGSPADFGFENN